MCSNTVFAVNAYHRYGLWHDLVDTGLTVSSKLHTLVPSGFTVTMGFITSALLDSVISVDEEGRASSAAK